MTKLIYKKRAMAVLSNKSGYRRYRFYKRSPDDEHASCEVDDRDIDYLRFEYGCELAPKPEKKAKPEKSEKPPEPEKPKEKPKSEKKKSK